MKILLLFLLLGIFISPAYSQKSKNSKESLDSLYARDIRQLRISFPGMEIHEHKDPAEFEYQFITNYLKNKRPNYPAFARQHGIQGKVYYRFVINKDGKVSDVKIIQGIGGGCDEECLSILSELTN